MPKHITLLLPNNPGEFYKVAHLMATHDVNIWAHHVANAGRHSLVQMVCIPHESALRLIAREYSYYATESEIIAVRIPNVPGQLLKILAVLKKNKLNITHVYNANHPEGDPIVIIDFEDAREREMAQQALIEDGFDVQAKLDFQSCM